MDLEAFRALLGPDGRRLADGISALGDPVRDPLTATSRLRRAYPDVPASVVAAVVGQARLRARAADKFGADASRMYFTADGLEQATRASVAAHRARAFAARGLPVPARVVDLCCGIGGDLIALARAGHEVRGVDRDPLTVEVARANLRALGLDDRATVEVGEVTAECAAGCDAVFCDPGRRAVPAGHAPSEPRRVFDPAAYSPPLPTALALASRARYGCVKVGPGIPHELLGRGAGGDPVPLEAEWISDQGEVKEAALWLNRAASPGDGPAEGVPARSATVLPAGVTLGADPAAGIPPVTPPRRFLYEPDGAVIRAHLVAEAAALVDGSLVDPSIAYLTADRLVDTPFTSAYEILDVIGFSLKRLRALLRDRGVGTVTIKKRGFAADVEELRRRLRPRGGAGGRGDDAVVVLTRLRGAPTAMLCRPAPILPRGENRTGI